MRILKSLARPGIRLLLMALAALLLTVSAFADDGCGWYVSTCPDGSSGGGSLVCCDSGSSGYSVCNCNAWSSDGGYSDCGHVSTGCYAQFIMTP